MVDVEDLHRHYELREEVQKAIQEEKQQRYLKKLALFQLMILQQRDQLDKLQFQYQKEKAKNKVEPPPTKKPSSPQKVKPKNPELNDTQSEIIKEMKITNEIQLNKLKQDHFTQVKLKDISIAALMKENETLKSKIESLIKSQQSAKNYSNALHKFGTSNSSMISPIGFKSSFSSFPRPKPEFEDDTFVFASKGQPKDLVSKLTKEQFNDLVEHKKTTINENQSPIAASSPTSSKPLRKNLQAMYNSPSKYIKDFDKEDENISKVMSKSASPEFTPKRISKPNLTAIKDTDNTIVDDTFASSTTSVTQQHFTPKKKRLQLWKSEISASKQSSFLEDEHLNTLNYYQDENIDLFSPINLKRKPDEEKLIKPLKKRHKNVFKIDQ